MKRSLRSWLWRVPVDQEVDEELAFHVEMRTRELIARGMDPKAARETAIARLGDLTDLKRTCVDLGRKRDREMRIAQWLEEFRDDVEFALRQMRSSPAFTTVAVATLALGIGANSAIFALVDATLLSPLPFPQPQRLVMLSERSETGARSNVSPMNMLDWQERNRSFDAIAAYVPNVGSMVLSGADGTALTVPRQWVTAGFFDVIGTKPIVGRTFTADDNSRRANAVVLSEDFWRSRFNGDASVVGRDIRLDGMAFTVVGVVPDELRFFGRTSMWGLVAIRRDPAARAAYVLQAVGRIKAEVTPEVAHADLTAVADALAQEYPATNQGRGVLVEPMQQALVGTDLRLSSVLFLGVVGFVLLICCANVANLLLARATVRTREMSIRSALGAGRRRIVRQLLTESLVLSLIGAGLGLGLGAWILSVAPAVIPQELLPPAVTLSFNPRMVAFCAVTALLVGILFGLAPAWQSTAPSTVQAIASETRSITGRGGRLRSLLVVGEVATAVLLLFGSGLLLRTLLAVDNVDRGYRANQVLTMIVDPLGSRYPTVKALLQFFDDVEREVRALPGVQHVGWASTLPLGRSYAGETFFDVVGDPPLDASRRPAADYQIVSPSYFDTIELPLVAGRNFNEHDTRESVPVCIVNEGLVRRHLSGRSPIGVRLALRFSPSDKPVIREIVGVARQVKGRPDETDELLQVYVPLAQNPAGDIFMLVRPGTQRAEALAPAVRAAIGRVDKEQLVSVRDVMTLESVRADATARYRFRALLVVTFAGLALLLAMVGVFGMLAYSVQQRVREVGVRRALGATTSDVFRLVAGGAARVIGIGLIAGLALSALLGRLLTSMLFNVEPLDPLTFTLVTIVVLVTAAVSTAPPVWRAARIDPASALRVE